MEKVFKIVSSCIWIVYAIFVVLSLLTSASNSNSLSLPFKSYIVRSGSMEPTIMTGDIIFITAQKRYAKNDIITFIDKEKRTVTHRVIEQAGNIFTTKGDNNQTPDPEQISNSAIVGKYTARIPTAGYILVAAQKPFGLFLLVAIPLILLIGSELFKEKPRIHETSKME